MKMIVMIQYVGHVVHAGGAVNYRTVEIELHEEQAKLLRLNDDEHFGPVAIHGEQHGNS